MTFDPDDRPDIFDVDDDFFDEVWTDRRDAAYREDPALAGEVDAFFEANDLAKPLPLYDHELDTLVLPDGDKSITAAYDEAVDVWIDALTYVANEASGTYTLPDGVTVDVNAIARADANFVTSILMSRLSAHADVLYDYVANEVES